MLPLVPVMMQTFSTSLLDIQPTIDTAFRESLRTTEMAPHHNRAPAINSTASAVGEWTAALLAFNDRESKHAAPASFPCLRLF
jgi:hypothetical protein